MWTNHWNLATICSIAIVANLMNVLPVDTICSIEYCGQFVFRVPIQNGILLFICSIEYCGQFALCVPIQNGIFLFICSIEYCGKFALCVWFKMGYFYLFLQLNIVANLLFACRFKMGHFCFNLAIAPHTVQLNECVRSTSESIHQSQWNRR